MNQNICQVIVMRNNKNKWPLLAYNQAGHVSMWMSVRVCDWYFMASHLPKPATHGMTKSVGIAQGAMKFLVLL